jgi:hypothetical protein
MNPSKICGHRTSLLLASLVVGAGLLGAADDAGTTQNSATAVVAGQSQNDEIARLKATLAEQQKQLQVLQQTLQNQQALLEKALDSQTTGAGNAGVSSGGSSSGGSSSGGSSSGGSSSGRFSGIGQVASTTPMIPIAPIIPVAPLPAAYPSPAAYPAPAAWPTPLPQGASSSGSTGNPCESPDASGPVPAYIRLGSVCIVPIGFMDLTPFWRDKSAGSSMGSNFGSVPYNNTANGNLNEARFSIQNSRLGLRVDGDWKGAHFIGYNEFDFNGTSGSGSLAVSNGAVVPRLRLFWVDVRKDKWEFLAGQSWSMMVPNRVGISALPGDLFYTQVIDINYTAGLTWTRQPGARVLYHPSKQVTFGLAVEQPDQYMGGSAGGSSAVLPAALLGLQGLQLDAGLNLGACTNNTAATATAVSYGCTGQGYLAQPAYTPDFIAKIAFDPSSRFHFDITGIESNFKTTSLAAPFVSHTTNGAGLQFGANAALLKNFRVITTNYWTDGDGRYMFGQAPDLIVRADGSLSAVHAAGTIDGVEAVVKNTLLYAYYGGIYIGRNVAIDTNGSLVGYGYKGSSNSQNRAINEITFGFNQTVWRDPRYGAFNIMGQYEWLERDPWYVAIGAPKATHDNTIYLDIRYTLPGSMPNF